MAERGSQNLWVSRLCRSAAWLFVSTKAVSEALRLAALGAARRRASLNSHDAPLLLLSSSSSSSLSEFFCGEIFKV
jgi:hypothetical protein